MQKKRKKHRLFNWITIFIVRATFLNNSFGFLKKESLYLRFIDSIEITV